MQEMIAAAQHLKKCKILMEQKSDALREASDAYSEAQGDYHRALDAYDEIHSACQESV